MLTKFEKFIKLVKEEKISHDYENYAAYTQIIKNERIKRKKTLGELSKGICSISYLCKLENNAIKPSVDYVKALLERVDVNYDEISKNNYDTELLQAIKLYFYHEYEEIKKLYDSLESENFDSRVAMIKCLYLLTINSFEEFREIISELDEIKNSFIGYQAIVLIFLVSEYYMKQAMYKNSYNYLLCLKEIDINQYELKMMIDEGIMISAFHLKKFPDVYNLYSNYIKDDKLYYPLERKLKIELIIKIINGKNCYDENELNDLMLKFKNEKDIFYYICLNHLVNENLHKVVSLLNENKELLEETRFLAIYGKCIYENSLEEMYEDFLGRVEKIDDVLENDKYYLSFIKMKLANDTSYELFEFLRYKILPFINKHYHIIYNSDYELTYVNILMKLSRYKEAANHLLNSR